MQTRPSATGSALPAVTRAHGDLVFAYTDGLVEARRDDEVFGTERLAPVVASLAGELSPEQPARRVHEEVVAWSGGLGDDAVALALRRRG